MLAVLILNVLTAGPPAGADAIVGTWIAPGKHGSARVRITRAGDTYEGTIVAIDPPVYLPGDPMAGRPVVDRENPDPALRARSLVGIRLLWGFRYDGDGEWVDGRIYDPESGNTYRSRARLERPDRLRLRGYVLVPVLGRSTVWTRVEDVPPGHPAH